MRVNLNKMLSLGRRDSHEITYLLNGFILLIKIQFSISFCMNNVGVKGAQCYSIQQEKTLFLPVLSQVSYVLTEL